jgi:hypothetical protein
MPFDPKVNISRFIIATFDANAGFENQKVGRALKSELVQEADVRRVRAWDRRILAAEQPGLEEAGIQFPRQLVFIVRFCKHVQLQLGPVSQLMLRCC